VSLKDYRKKRSFDVTAEPEGRAVAARKNAKAAKPLVFVVQKHRATALHYDFRLEWRGVMLSWAVPKGPSLDPAVKRMAMAVEDHPLEYNQFEGIIPEGQYGGGTVMIWDRGTWTPEVEDVDAALAAGTLKFGLIGKKLSGSWVLVRTRPGPGQKRAAWLLIKHRDAAATTEEIAEKAPRSVVSDRLLVEIARDEGGDMKRAADGDPAAARRHLLEDVEKSLQATPKLKVPRKKSRAAPRKRNVQPVRRAS
jgi:bifunctional non-homologous end joining protein LigD